MNNKVNLSGEKIWRLRMEKGLTQSDLAELVGISTAYVSLLENGKPREPKIGTALCISKALDVPIEYLIEESETNHCDAEGDKVLIHRFKQLNDRDQKRIHEIIGLWLNKDYGG